MGLPDFPPRFDTDLLRPFWDAVAEGDFRLPSCSICGRWQWYPFETVRCCHQNAGLEWKRVPKTGTVFTFASVERCFLPASTESIAPYVVALVELDDTPGPRIVTLLTNLNNHEPQIGMRVRLSPIPMLTHTLPAFEPENP